MSEQQKQLLTFVVALLLAGLILQSLMGCYLTRPIETTAVVTRAYYTQDGMWCWKHLVDTGAWLEVCSFSGGDLGGFTYGDLYVKHTGSIPVVSTNER